MVTCFGNTFKVPHATNRSPLGRERILRLFIRIFVFVYAIVSSSELLVSVIIRLKLGVPLECSDIPENAYASTDMMIAVSLLSLIMLILTYARAKYIKRSRHLQGHVACYVVVVAIEVFVIIVAAVQSSRIRLLVNSHGEVFTNTECIKKIQSRHDCCGFKSFAEWLSHANYTDVHESDESPLESIFPPSCRCTETGSDRCVQMTYIISNSTFSSLSLSSDQTTDSTLNVTHTNTTTILTTQPTIQSGNSHENSSDLDTYHVHTTACFSAIIRDLKDVQLATGISTVLAIAFQLLIFASQYYLIHNLEGRTTVSDSSGSSRDTFDLPERSLTNLSFVDLNSVHLHVKQRDTSWTSAESEGGIGHLDGDGIRNGTGAFGRDNYFNGGGGRGRVEDTTDLPAENFINTNRSPVSGVQVLQVQPSDSPTT